MNWRWRWPAAATPPGARRSPTICRRPLLPGSTLRSTIRVTWQSGIDNERIPSVVRQGGIYHEILEEAAAVKADLIVMTSHRPAMRTYFLGSNAGHVVRYAKCSVLVVRH